jgi:hypothetical protein
MKASALIIIFLAAVFTNVISGEKAERVKQLSRKLDETMEKQFSEANKKYLAELEWLVNSLPKSDPADQIAVQKEILRAKFVGRYQTKNNSDFRIHILRDGTAYQPKNHGGSWKIEMVDGKFFITVYVGPWTFTLDADQVDRYEGTLSGNGKSFSDGLIRIK